jgi:hypothetical protein
VMALGTVRTIPENEEHDPAKGLRSRATEKRNSNKMCLPRNHARIDGARGPRKRLSKIFRKTSSGEQGDALGLRGGGVTCSGISG